VQLERIPSRKFALFNCDILHSMRYEMDIRFLLHTHISKGKGEKCKKCIPIVSDVEIERAVFTIESPFSSIKKRYQIFYFSDSINTCLILEKEKKKKYIYIYIYTPTLNFNCTLLRKRIRTYFQFYGMNSEAQSQVQVTG